MDVWLMLPRTTTMHACASPKNIPKVASQTQDNKTDPSFYRRYDFFFQITKSFPSCEKPAAVIMPHQLSASRWTFVRNLVVGMEKKFFLSRATTLGRRVLLLLSQRMEETMRLQFFGFCYLQLHWDKKSFKKKMFVIINRFGIILCKRFFLYLKRES